MFEVMQMTHVTPDSRRTEAQEIGDMWRRVSRQHLSSGQGCACGFGGGLMLQGAAFELDIVEFLLDEAKQAGHADIEAFVDGNAKRGVDNFSLSALIEALGRTNATDSLSDVSRAFALQRLKKTLGSMDAAHARGRFACD
jgi:hypothetical protein